MELSEVASGRQTIWVKGCRKAVEASMAVFLDAAGSITVTPPAALRDLNCG